MAASGLILFAEDDRRLRKLYTDALEASGYQVIATSDGDEAVEMLHTVRPRVILLDIMMPRMNGIETCKRARKMVGGEIPVVFLTALDQIETLHECIAAGGDDFVMKSEGVTAVVERVGRWMRQTRGRTRLAARREDVLADLALQTSRRTVAAPVSGETDESMRQISEFPDEAHAQARGDFGKTANE